MTRAQLIEHLDWCEYMLRAMVEGHSNDDKYDWSSGVRYGFETGLRFVTEGREGAARELEADRKKREADNGKKGSEGPTEV
jgi:hypothetical protein